jgi:hypothetical protein
MIGKGKSISHTQASMKYGWNQEKEAEIVYSQNIVGDSPQEISREFEQIQKLNEHCERNTLSFVLSPTIEDGRTLDQRKLGELTKDFMREMKLGERQAIAFVHQDKEHKHVHLYVNRIDFDGRAYKDNFIGKRSQHAAERVAHEHQLTTVREVQLIREINLTDIRLEIKRRHELTMKQFKPETYKAYMRGMETNGVKAIPFINKQQKLQGFRFEFDGHSLKGSSVHRSMSMSNIGKQMAREHGIEKFKELNKTISLAKSPEPVQISLKLLKEIAQKVIKKSISKGMDIGY